MTDLEDHLNRGDHFRKAQNKKSMKFQKLLIKAFQNEDIILGFNEEIQEEVDDLEQKFGQTLEDDKFCIKDLE
jgi:hypothetical protein